MDKENKKLPVYSSSDGGWTEDGELIEKFYVGQYTPTSLGWLLYKVKNNYISIQEAYSIILLMIVKGDVDI